MGFQDLPHIHSGRYSQRIEYDFDRCPVWQSRHILFWYDFGDYPFVAMPTGNFISDRQLALHGDVDFDNLYDARRQLVAFFQDIAFFLVDEFQSFDLTLDLFIDVLDLFFSIFIHHQV